MKLFQKKLSRILLLAACACSQPQSNPTYEDADLIAASDAFEGVYQSADGQIELTLCQDDDVDVTFNSCLGGYWFLRSGEDQNSEPGSSGCATGGCTSDQVNTPARTELNMNGESLTFAGIATLGVEDDQHSERAPLGETVTFNTDVWHEGTGQIGAIGATLQPGHGLTLDVIVNAADGYTESTTYSLTRVGAANCR